MLHVKINCFSGLYAPPVSEFCLSCPPGKSCNNITEEPVDCGDGFYSIGGKVVCL